MLTASAYANPLPPFPRLGRRFLTEFSIVLVILIDIASDIVGALCLCGWDFDEIYCWALR